MTVENSKLRATAYKLYRWICSKTDSGVCVSAKLKDIRQGTGLSDHAIINGRRELEKLKLISTSLSGGPGGSYYISTRDPHTALSYRWNCRPVPRYFPVPYASMLPEIYCDKWTGTDALIYDALAARMGKAGCNELQLSGIWFSAVSKNTLRACEQCLSDTGFIRVRNRAIEILHPETSASMPPKGADREPAERAYYIDSVSGARKLLHEEGLTPEHFEMYFSKSLPRGAEWWPGHDAHCPFHNDERPSLSIDVETGKWCCHACGFGGNKLVSFEMRLLDTEDVHAAWANVAKKIGFKLGSRHRGKITHRHIYRDENGDLRYMVRRYDDGSASYCRYVGYQLKPGLAGKKRILYNLPEVISAAVVLLVEGEKKADILTGLNLADTSGGRVAVTTSGGADSWRIEHVEHLKGKRILLLPDEDEPGQRYAAAVQASLKRAGIEYATVSFDEYGNDFRDFLKSSTPTELVDFIGSPWLTIPQPEVEIRP